MWERRMSRTPGLNRCVKHSTVLTVSPLPLQNRTTPFFWYRKTGTFSSGALGPSLGDFMRELPESQNLEDEMDLPASSACKPFCLFSQSPLSPLAVHALVLALDPTTVGRGKTVFIETYGCQMNTSDSEIVQSIMEKAGFSRASEIDEADVILVNTCAIREKAEQKIWDRLDYFKSLKRKQKNKKRSEALALQKPLTN